MKKYEYEIAGLDCAACANEIQEGLNKNPEIKNANVNFDLVIELLLLTIKEN